MLTSLLGGLLLAARLAVAQSEEPTSVPATATESGSVPTVSAFGTATACAQISSIQASYASASPSATLGPKYEAKLAYACAKSAPIIQEDALRLIDGIMAVLQFQSTIDFLPSPPSEYPLAGVDMLAELKDIRGQVQSGAFDNEIDFETQVAKVLAKAHDGHLAFVFDGLSVFSYSSQFASLVSISRDGKEIPKIYYLPDVVRFLRGESEWPSSVTQINGEDPTQYVTTFVENGTFGNGQDPDQMYNSFFYSYNNGANTFDNPGLFVGAILTYSGDTTKLTWENGTEVELDNYATTKADFTGVVDGDSFYQSFLNATHKAAALSSATATASPTDQDAAAAATETSTPAVTQLPQYPSPVAISSDGALSGYFLDVAGYEDTAVLVMRSMSQAAPESFQAALKDFLDQCRSTKKKNLIVDLSGNGGGTITLGYDSFKQLFPTVEPYGAGNLRAHEGYEILGSAITNLSTSVMQQQPDNYTAYVNVGGTTAFAAESYLNDSNVRFESFEELYGPVKVDGHGQYTNLIRLDIANPEFTEAFGAITITGYGNESNPAPQPFESENIIMLTDGACGSTCSIFSHFMKWQGKVKSIAIGGRPQTGPMQPVGAVKGSQVTDFVQLYSTITSLAALADQATLDAVNGTSVGTIYNDGQYLLLRTASAGASGSEFSFNLKNNIAEGDKSDTPLQFVYEAADCRLYYTPEHYNSIVSIWGTVANQAFGANGTTPYDLCVAGSTGQPSSLSGDPTLYNNGNPTNVTDFIPENSTNTTSPGTYQGSGSSLRTSGSLAFIMALVAALTLGL